jgi:uncharacterized protein (TIGR03437 family)
VLLSTPTLPSIGASPRPPGIYYGTLTIFWATGATIVPITFTVTPTPQFPPLLSAIVNSASERPGAIAPGEIITLFGGGVGPLPTQVLINGAAARVIYASGSQVNAVVPFALGTSGTATVQVVSNGVASATWEVPVTSTAAAIFTTNSTGVGQAAVLNQDNTINGASNPAAKGTVIQIFATGGGASPTPSAKVTIGGADAPVQFAGPAPGEIEGLVQVNAVVPPSVTAGPSVSISVAFGNSQSQSGATIAVQ